MVSGEQTFIQTPGFGEGNIAVIGGICYGGRDFSAIISHIIVNIFCAHALRQGGGCRAYPSAHVHGGSLGPSMYL